MAYQSMLSQDEVDALLDGDVEQSPSEILVNDLDAGVQPYDLGSPDKVIRSRLQTLEYINERFARRMRVMFFSFLRRNADITVNPIKIGKYSDFERNLPIPSNLNMVAIKPLKGASLFCFDPNLAFLIIESLFGGHGKYTTRVEGRDFTNTEQRIIRRLLNHTLDCYKESWLNIYPIELDYIRSEMHTKFASIGANNDAMVISKFDIEFGTTKGALSICLPYSMIEPIKDVLTRPPQHSGSSPIDRRWSEQLSHEIKNTEVQIKADFTKINTNISKLLKLQKGDILPIDLKNEVLAKVGGIPIMSCTYGTSNGHYALSINELFKSARDSNLLISKEKK